MKEATETISEGITQGLRRFKTNPRNKHSLVECHNLAPAEKGLETHEALVSLNSDISLGGYGSKSHTPATSTVTIDITDYVDDSDIVGASVYIDEVLVGVTDANGEIDVELTAGGHSLRVTAAGYVDSDDDDLLNDYFVVT